jgi:hypothetical protein
MPRLRARVITRNVPTPSITNYVRTASGDTLMTLPLKAALANKLLGFTSVGEPVATSMPSVATVTLAEFANSTTLTAATIDPSIDWLRLAGRSSVGDQGQGLYKRRVGVPSHSAYYTSNGGTVVWELADPVIRPEHLGALGDGAANDATAIGNWHTACAVLRRPGHATPGATYRVTSAVTISNSNIDIDWKGAIVAGDSASNNVNFLRYVSTDLYGTVILSGNQPKRATSIGVTDASLLAVGRYLLFDWSFPTFTSSHVSKIIGLAGTVVTLESPLPFAVDVGDTYTITVASALTGVSVKNLIVDGTAATGTGMNGIVFSLLDASCRVENVRTRDFTTTGSGGFSAQYCYGTRFIAPSSNNSGTSAAAAIWFYHCTGVRVNDLLCEFDNGFGFEALAGSYLHFSNPTVIGSDGRAFKFAGVRSSTVQGGFILNDRGSGVGLAVTLGSQDNTFIGTQIHGQDGSQSQGVWTSDFDDINNLFIGLSISGCAANPIAVAGASDTGNKFFSCFVDDPDAIMNLGAAEFYGLNGQTWGVGDNSAAQGPFVTTVRYSTTPAASDYLAARIDQGYNASGAVKTYGYQGTKIVSTTAGAEHGSCYFSVVHAGGYKEVLIANGTNVYPATTANIELGSSSFQWLKTHSVEYNVGGVKVVGAQGAAVADATDAASVIARLNDLLARLRTHGLIAT